MIRVGIIFGGPSREREISFAGGRTVYDNLNKDFFEPVPLFVDSFKKLVLLDWENIYKGSIRDFFPPIDVQPKSEHNFQIYQESLPDHILDRPQQLHDKIGHPIEWHELNAHIDFAFLVLHGAFGEDGQVQGLLESLGIPYSGADILSSAIGMHKGFQKQQMDAAGWDVPSYYTISQTDWDTLDRHELFQEVQSRLDAKYVVRPCNQGSSIGLSIEHTERGFDAFESAVDRAFFRWTLKASEFPQSASEQAQLVAHLADIKEGPAFPLKVDDEWISHPEELLSLLKKSLTTKDEVHIEAASTDDEVLVEEFIDGKEFSCIVIRDEQGTLLALPPTEIRKLEELFDYRSKYLPGFVRKITPMEIQPDWIENIQNKCKALLSFFSLKSYARIDGFIKSDGTIYLNDPNTTSGMLPSSFFFHQAAQIGLSPSEIITVIIRSSLEERKRHALSRTTAPELITQLDQKLAQHGKEDTSKIKVGIIMGGFSFERHISMESGRNIYEKLASSSKYKPIPLFLLGNEEEYKLYQMPIKLLLKDNADDIRDYILAGHRHDMLPSTKLEAQHIMATYIDKDRIMDPVLIPWEELADKIDVTFIALHGRPGEDGNLQKKLRSLGIPFNGSSAASSAITINKFETAKILKANGLLAADQLILTKDMLATEADRALERIIGSFGLPLIAKPLDDGCSSAVIIIRSKEQLKVYCQSIFRETTELTAEARTVLNLHLSDEFPQKEEVLIENLIQANGASKFIEITGGMLTKYQDGELIFEVFEPSEALATDDILSLEEKFLAGQGQNLTPARYSDDPIRSAEISAQVKGDLLKAAQILNIEGYCRIDAFVRIFDDGRVETVFIEVNSLPGMTPATCIFHQTALAGLKPYDFIDKILEFSLSKQEIS